MGLAKAIVWKDVVLITFSAGPNAALLTLPNVTVFIADTDYRLEAVSEVHETLGTDGSAVTLDLVKCTGTQAAASGTTMLASTFNLKATINTVVRKSKSGGGLSATTANVRVASGDRIALNFGGTTTALSGLCVSLWLKAQRRPSY